MDARLWAPSSLECDAGSPLHRALYDERRAGAWFASVAPCVAGTRRRGMADVSTAGFIGYDEPMAGFHHRPLPDYPTLLSGHTPPDDVGFQSHRLQIWFNHTDQAGADPAPHAHLESDECFVVLTGRLVVEVEGERVTVGPRELCCFAAGVYHAVVEVFPPVETLMIRAPSLDDKVCR